MKRWYRQLLLSSVVVLTTASFFFHPLFARQSGMFSIVRSIDLLGDVFREVSLSYVDSIDVGKFMFAGIDGMLETLDPYTVFLDKEESVELGEITSGQYGGIGVTIAGIDNGVYVVSVLDGFSASRAGIKVGDQLISVDGTSIRQDSLESVKNLLKGTPGTSLNLILKRYGAQANRKLTLTRQEIKVNSIRYAGLIGDIGYFEMSSFGNRSAEELSAAISELNAEAEGSGQRMKAVILDLRNNPGGLLDVAVDVSGLFVRQGSEVVSIRGRLPESENRYVTKRDPVAGDLPLSVLINSKSASASEIVAGAIQELDRGVVIGARSFGKGLVQSIIPLPYDCKLKMTSARYYTPSGRLIQKYHAGEDGWRSVIHDSGRQDSSRVFYTLNRRKVYGGGGILPDIPVSEPESDAYEAKLKKKGMFFRYASAYRALHPKAPGLPMKREGLLNGFNTFLEEEGFSFESEPEVLLDQMKLSTAELGRSSRLDSLFNEVEREVSMLTERYRVDDRERIALAVEREILRHYDEDAARRLSLEQDPVVKKALDVLNSPKQYRSVLKP